MRSRDKVLGMRGGVGNVPEPPAPRTAVIVGTRGRITETWRRVWPAAGWTLPAEPRTAAGLFLSLVSPRQGQSGA